MWQVLTGNAPDGQEPRTTLEFDFDVRHPGRPPPDRRYHLYLFL
jgi:hypothetical protein